MKPRHIAILLAVLVAPAWSATKTVTLSVPGMNCAACHEAESLKQSSKQAPRLANIGSRLNPAYIETFIRDPHGIKKGTI